MLIIDVVAAYKIQHKNDKIIALQIALTRNCIIYRFRMKGNFFMYSV